MFVLYIIGAVVVVVFGAIWLVTYLSGGYL